MSVLSRSLNLADAKADHLKSVEVGGPHRGWMATFTTTGQSATNTEFNWERCDGLYGQKL